VLTKALDRDRPTLATIIRPAFPESARALSDVRFLPANPLPFAV
jgi:hypothetical protein